MITDKNDIFIGLKLENSYLVGGGGGLTKIWWGGY